MSETVNAPDPARLDELAAVTKEYARYSWRAFGLAHVALGGWMAVALAVRVVSVPWAAVLFACGSLFWVVLLPRARAYYQRHGGVTEPEDQVAMFFMDFTYPVLAWAFAVLVPFALWREYRAWAFQTGALGWAGLVVAAAAFVLAVVLARKRLAAYGTERILVLVPAVWATASGSRFVEVWPAAVVSAALVARGVYDHVAYRRLERRLAALKGSTS